MPRAKEDTIRIGGETFPRRLEYSGPSTLRSDEQPPVNIDWWADQDDNGGVTKIVIELETQPGEPGLTTKELSSVDLGALRHNRVLQEIWNRRAPIRTEDFDTGRSYDQLAREHQEQTSRAMRAASKALRKPPSVPPERLAEILDLFVSKGINAVMKLGPYSRSYAYKLVAQAREEVRP